MHPLQVPEAMKALRNLLSLSVHPPWHIQPFSSSPEPKRSFKSGLPPRAATVQPASAQQKIKLISLCICCLSKSPCDACSVAPAFAKRTPPGTAPPPFSQHHHPLPHFNLLDSQNGLSQENVSALIPALTLCTEPSLQSEASLGLVFYLFIVIFFFLNRK